MIYNIIRVNHSIHFETCPEVLEYWQLAMALASQSIHRYKKRHKEFLSQVSYINDKINRKQLAQWYNQMKLHTEWEKNIIHGTSSLLRKK